MGTNKSSLKKCCGNCKYFYVKPYSLRTRGLTPTWSFCEFLKRLHIIDTEVNKEDQGCEHWTPYSSKTYHHGTC